MKPRDDLRLKQSGKLAQNAHRGGLAPQPATSCLSRSQFQEEPDKVLVTKMLSEIKRQDIRLQPLAPRLIAIIRQKYP
jgi:hypothetical protein